MDELHRDKAISTLGKALMLIAIIGALNWGLIGFFNWNLVDAILGGGSAEETSTASRVVYVIVGLAGLVALFLLPKLHTVTTPVTTRTTTPYAPTV